MREQERAILEEEESNASPPFLLPDLPSLPIQLPAFFGDTAAAAAAGSGAAGGIIDI